VKRRKFITLLGCAITAWPLAGMPVIGVLGSATVLFGLALLSQPASGTAFSPAGLQPAKCFL